MYLLVITSIHDFVFTDADGSVIYFAALALEKEIGNFQVGKSFDALIVNLASSFSPVDIFPGNDINELVQKFIMLGDDRNVVTVFVNGQVVKSLQK